MTSTRPDRKAVLVVDDDEVFLRSVIEGLAVSAEELRVVGAKDGDAALEALATDRFDLLLTDLRMPGIDGFELLRRLALAESEVPVIVMSALGANEVGNRLAGVDLVSLLDKPLDFEQLLDAIRAALASRGPATAQADREPDREPDQQVAAVRSAAVQRRAAVSRADTGASATPREPNEDTDGAA